MSQTIWDHWSGIESISKTVGTHGGRKIHKTIDEIDQVNIWTNDEPKILNLSKHSSLPENEKLLSLLHEFLDVFAWSYSNIKGFDPAVINHAIPLKREFNRVKKTKRPLNPTLGATIRAQLEKFLATHIIIPI